MNRDVKHIYFIGIGGISMSGLAELMLYQGKRVSGSDWNKSKLVDKLINNGATVYIGEHEENITNDIDLLVYTSAVREDHPELVKAKALNLNIMTRAEFLGDLMHSYNHAICVSGTHGKTTTTGMLSQVLINTELDPTIFLGGELSCIDGNIRIGKQNVLLTEACEYKRNFLQFNPSVEIILNVEEDHLDYYKDIKDIESAFKDYAHRLGKDGLLVVNYEYKDLFNDCDCNVATFGLNDTADIYPTNVQLFPHPKFTAVYKNEELCDIELSVYGEHNVLNSLATIVAMHEVGIDTEIIKKGLKDFRGTKRRFEFRGEKNGVQVIDDYAHHPTEIKTSLTTAKNLTTGNVITIFQPHTFTRTYELMDEFAKVFELSDYVIIIDIYAAREFDTGLVNSKQLVEKIKQYNQNVCYAENFDIAAAKALDISKNGDIIIAMGAGNVGTIADLLLK